MTDIIDRAKELEMQHRQRCLDEALNRRAEPAQQIVGGVVLCIDCDEPVRPARLLAKPDAARCAHCQEIEERKHGRF